jgi:hypothetical protein
MADGGWRMADGGRWVGIFYALDLVVAPRSDCTAGLYFRINNFLSRMLGEKLCLSGLFIKILT